MVLPTLIKNERDQDQRPFRGRKKGTEPQLCLFAFDHIFRPYIACISFHTITTIHISLKKSNNPLTLSNLDDFILLQVARAFSSSSAE